MDWFLYDNDPRYERVKHILNIMRSFAKYYYVKHFSG